MEEVKKEEYIVVWNKRQKFKRRGFVNRLFGKTVVLTKPLVYKYDDPAVAHYGYRMIKNHRHGEPFLLKVVR